jgi:tRNA-dependent cyclodipeptide synthase
MKCNRIVINQIKKALDSKEIPYMHISYSNAFPFEKIQRDQNELGKEHIESVLIEIIDADDIPRIAMIVVPATRKIDLKSLQKILDNQRVGFVGKQTGDLFPDYEIGTLPPFADFYPCMDIYLTDEVLQLQEVAIYIQSYADCIRMSLDAFLSIAHHVENISVATTAKYKIEVAQVFPETHRNKLQDYHHCILGFSLQSHSFVPARLASMTEWISSHFSECTVFIGDSIHRFTLEIDGIPAQYALNKALKIGRDAIDQHAIIFNRHQDHCKFNLIMCSELQKEEEYDFYHEQLVKLFEEDEQFRKSVYAFSEMFVGKRPCQNQELLDYHRKLSQSYLLEEAACFAMLVKKGIYLFVYPGVLTIFQELSQGMFPNAPEELKNMISVNIRQKKR